MKDLMKKVKSLKESGLLSKGVNEKIENETVEQKSGFLGMLLSKLSGNRQCYLDRQGRNYSGTRLLMTLHPLTDFEIQRYYQNEPKFMDIYFRNNLLKIKDGAYVINLDEHKSIGTHYVATHVKNDVAKYFDNFCMEHIPKEF